MESTRKSVLLEKVGYRTKPRGSPTFRICVEGESAKETEKYRRERSNTKKGHPRNQGGGGDGGYLWERVIGCVRHCCPEVQ